MAELVDALDSKSSSARSVGSSPTRATRLIENIPLWDIFYLYCILQIKCRDARIISQPALDILKRAGVFVEYDELVCAIRNRTNDGFCPMEQAVWNIDDPESALSAIYDTLSKLS